MKKKSLVIQRIMYDHCSAVKMELHNFNVIKELLISCLAAEVQMENIRLHWKNKKKKWYPQRRVRNGS